MKAALIAVVLLLFPTLACATSPPPLPTPQEDFERLKALVGEWEGKTEGGRVLRVSYRLTAKDTVLIETWTLGPGRESMTVYHLDGPRLVATHYCPIGNQPRLELKPQAGSDTLVFEFVSGSNLLSPAMARQSRFEIKFQGKDQYWRNETYSSAAYSGSEGTTYSRVR